MTKAHKLYKASIICLGLLVLCFCVARAIPYFSNGDMMFWMYCGILVGLMVLCRMLPIHIGGGRQLDISFVPVLACAMTSDYSIAVVLHTVSSLLSIIKDPVTTKFYSPFIKSPDKEFFNLGNINISVGLIGFLFSFLNPDPAHLMTPRMLVIFFTYAVAVIACNFLLFVLYFATDNDKSLYRLVGTNLRTIIPSVLCTIPLGLMFALLLDNPPQGYLFILLLMAPLLMARYSFKMYLDTRSVNMRTIAALSNAIEAKDPYTRGHSRRVAFYSEAIAHGMQRPRAYVENIRTAALLHDVGKIGINDAVLLKEGPLARSEFSEIQRHPQVGYKIIKSVFFPQMINDAVRYHHLRYDLTGYPQEDKLPKKLPLSAGILAVADAYDAMTSDRPYRKGIEQKEALAIIEKQAGVQFDPQVVSVFVSIMPQLDAAQLEMDVEQEIESTI